jgi:hypothetical protein
LTNPNISILWKRNTANRQESCDCDAPAPKNPQEGRFLSSGAPHATDAKVASHHMTNPYAVASLPVIIV